IFPLGLMDPNFALMLARDLPEIVQTGYHLIPYFIFDADKGLLSQACKHISSNLLVRGRQPKEMRVPHSS
ncbi:hypothetical protein Tco_0024708, partial [Tanacetum coccineum]